MSYYLYYRREGVAAEFFFIFEFFEFFSYRIRVLSTLQNETVEQKDEKVVGTYFSLFYGSTRANSNIAKNLSSLLFKT